VAMAVAVKLLFEPKLVVCSLCGEVVERRAGSLFVALYMRMCWMCDVCAQHLRECS